MFFIYDQNNNYLFTVTDEEMIDYTEYENYSYVETDHPEHPLPWTYENPEETAFCSGVKSFGSCSDYVSSIDTSGVLDESKIPGTVSFMPEPELRDVLIVGTPLTIHLDDKEFCTAEIATVIELEDGSLDFTIKNVRVTE